MLVAALFFGQVLRKMKQPAVLGEMIGGVILGPTVVGIFLPEFSNWLFQSSGNITAIRDGSIKLGMLFYLFIAGLDINLSEVRKLSGKVLTIGLFGTLIPIATGMGITYMLGTAFWGPVVVPHFFSFALFVGINFGNSAIPVLSRILMDLGILKQELGSLMMSSAVVDDLLNWTLFAIVLSDISPVLPAGEIGLPLSILTNVIFLFGVLLIGRWLSPYALRWARKNVTWPSGFIGFTTLVILFASSFAERIGIHAFFGALLAGIAVGQSNADAKEAHDVITHFVLSFFAPIYFVSLGMTTNFLANFDFLLVTLLLVVATVSKVGAVLIGAQLSGLPLSRETWAIGFGLNARGATGLILANVGLTNGLIDERIYVAMVTMAIFTSMIAGPVINRLLGERIRIENIDPHEEILRVQS